MKILVHSPVSNRAWCLPIFLQAMANQRMPEHQVEYLFDLNDSQDASGDLLNSFSGWSGAVTINEHSWPPLGMVDHTWSPERYARMIEMRNGAITTAAYRNADYIFSVDSDVILEDPETLAHLVEANVPIIAGVFMTDWGNPEAKKLPNVWQRGQNEMSDEFLEGIAWSPDHVDVGGLGACTLIRRDVWEAGVNYSPIYNVPTNYRGEDRYFCLRAAVHGFGLVACSHKKINHLCRERTSV